MPQRERVTLLALALVAGLAQAATGIVLYVTGNYFAAWSGMVSTAVLFLCIVIGLRWYRDNRRDGYIDFPKALALGAVIALGTGAVYAIYNIITIDVVYPHFLDDMARARVAAEAARGQAAVSYEAIRTQLSAPRIAVTNFIFLTSRGIILSVLVALIVRRRSQSTPREQMPLVLG